MRPRRDETFTGWVVIVTLGLWLGLVLAGWVLNWGTQ